MPSAEKCNILVERKRPYKSHSKLKYGRYFIGVTVKPNPKDRMIFKSVSSFCVICIDLMRAIDDCGISHNEAIRSVVNK